MHVCLSCAYADGSESSIVCVYAREKSTVYVCMCASSCGETHTSRKYSTQVHVNMHKCA